MYINFIIAILKFIDTGFLEEVRYLIPIHNAKIFEKSCCLVQAGGNLASSEDAKAIGAASSAAGLGSIAVATVTTAAPGILGAIGLTTTSVVALLAVGIVAGSHQFCFKNYH